MVILTGPKDPGLTTAIKTIDKFLLNSLQNGSF